MRTASTSNPYSVAHDKFNGQKETRAAYRRGGKVKKCNRGGAAAHRDPYTQVDADYRTAGEHCISGKKPKPESDRAARGGCEPRIFINGEPLPEHPQPPKPHVASALQGLLGKPGKAAPAASTRANVHRTIAGGISIGSDLKKWTSPRATFDGSAQQHAPSSRSDSK